VRDGGGSGGGVYLTCSTLSGTNIGFSAVGGVGSLYGGGGGGGRIAVWRQIDTSSGISYSVLGAAGASGNGNGSNGTFNMIYFPILKPVYNFFGTVQVIP